MTQKQKTYLIKSASIASVLIAAILISAKAYAYYVTKSMSVKASLIDSVLDILASLVNFFAIHHALKPADKDHRFGHGKIEALAGLMQSLIIAVSAIWLFYEAFERLYLKETFAMDAIALWVMVGSTVLTILLVWWQVFVVKRTGSLAIEADSLHYKTDILTNLGVIITLLGAQYLNVYWLDACTALIIAFYILKTSYEIGKKAFDILIDKELGSDIRCCIEKTALSFKEVKGVHDIRTRSSGSQNFFQFHLDFDKGMNIQEAHDTGEKIRHILEKKYPDTDILIHHDPV